MIIDTTYFFALVIDYHKIVCQKHSFMIHFYRKRKNNDYKGLKCIKKRINIYLLFETFMIQLIHKLAKE